MLRVCSRASARSMQLHRWHLHGGADCAKCLARATVGDLGARCDPISGDCRCVPADSVPTDSLRRLRIARLDSLSDVVAARKGTIAAAGRVEEIKRIEAKLTPAGSFRFQGAQYSAIRVNPADLSMHCTGKNTAGEKYLNIGSLKDLEKNGDQVVMMTNAGMYNPDNSPQGLFIEKGKQLVPLDTAKGPEGQMLNFYLKPMRILPRQRRTQGRGHGKIPKKSERDQVCNAVRAHARNRRQAASQIHQRLSQHQYQERGSSASPKTTR